MTPPMRGHQRPGKNKIRQTCDFDPDLYQSIRAAALAEGMTFSAKVRELCEWGLDETETDE